jgi:hypothetical protein
VLLWVGYLTHVGDVVDSGGDARVVNMFQDRECVPCSDEELEQATPRPPRLRACSGHVENRLSDDRQCALTREKITSIRSRCEVRYSGSSRFEI